MSSSSPGDLRPADGSSSTALKDAELLLFRVSLFDNDDTPTPPPPSILVVDDTPLILFNNPLSIKEDLLPFGEEFDVEVVDDVPSCVDVLGSFFFVDLPPLRPPDGGEILDDRNCD